MENKNKRPAVKILNFNQAYEPPVNKINVARGWVEWGAKNNYPVNTFEMYNYTGSSTSKSIINKKNSLTTGNGFEPIKDPRLQEFIDAMGLERQTKRIGLDYEIINAFAWEVVWSNDGTTITDIQHMPIHKLRQGVECEEIPFPHFLFSNDWGNVRKKENHPEPIRAFNPMIKQGKQVVVYYEYNPLCEAYSIEPYSNCMNWIEMDYEISKFHLNQIKQGYHPSFVLNFATGIPSEEEMEEFNRDFERRFQGSDGAGQYLLTFSEGKEEAPTIETIQLNDSDDRFAMLMEQTEIQIARGHEVPPQMVVLTPGKLSGTDERMELLSEFQLAYITPRQRNLEDVLNLIIRTAGYTEELRLAEYGKEVSETEVIEEEDGQG